jgi:hypothetical protein
MSGPGGGGGGNDNWRPQPRPAPERPQPAAGGQDGGGAAGEDPCNIVERTPLNSPNSTVLATLRVGDILNVVYVPGPPQRLVAEQSHGVIAGSITSPSMLQIIQCIQRGYAYVAEVMSIRGAICEVTVRPP